MSSLVNHGDVLARVDALEQHVKDLSKLMKDLGKLVARLASDVIPVKRIGGCLAGSVSHAPSQLPPVWIPPSPPRPGEPQCQQEEQGP